MMAPRPRTTRRAFTLMELLVVLGLIAIAVGITVPALDALQRSGRGGAAANSISVAVNAARIYNHRIGHSDLGDAGWPYADEARYSGTAALFTPAGEVRLVVNDQAASDQDGQFIEGDDGPGDGFAFRDIQDIDYIRLPRTARLVGVRYDGDGTPQVLPPPFAVRFNEYGNIATDDDYIYYDRNDKGYYATDAGRSEYDNGNYNPDNWSRTTAPIREDGRRELPFDRIEVVSGVIAFNTREYYNYLNHREAEGDELDETFADLGPLLRDAYAGEDVDSATRRLAENSTPINFSPLTGLSIRASQR